MLCLKKERDSEPKLHIEGKAKNLFTPLYIAGILKFLTYSVGENF